MPHREREAGEFCWINLLTPDPTAAAAFFGSVLGWDLTPMPPYGQMIRVDGAAVGGLFDLNGPECPTGIGVMVRVDDADAAAERIRALGGQAKPPFAIAENGRMVVCHDPTGASFDLWEPRQQPGTAVDPLASGAPSWFETLTTDPDAATAFYTELFGWTADARAIGPEFTYTTFRRHGVPVAGLMRAPRPEIPPHWGTYFTVEDTDAAALRVTEAGGSLFIPPSDIPEVGRFCGLLSPQGVRAYAITYRPGLRG